MMYKCNCGKEVHISSDMKIGIIKKMEDNKMCSDCVKKMKRKKKNDITLNDSIKNNKGKKSLDTL